MYAYKLIYRERAIKEYLHSIDWYKEKSIQASEDFIAAVRVATAAIQKDPYLFRNSYKNYYEIKTKNFPFSIIYFISERKKIIVITMIFHQKRSPSKKFR